MKMLIFIFCIMACHLINTASSQGEDCTFAHKAFELCQRNGEVKFTYFKELDDMYQNEHKLYMTEDDPEYEVWAPTGVAQTSRDDLPYDYHNTLLEATKMINYKINLHECNELSQYTSCFKLDEVCYNRTNVKCNAQSKYREPGGECNNLHKPYLGTPNSAYSRLLQPSYGDCIHSHRRCDHSHTELESPRVIGNKFAEKYNEKQTSHRIKCVLNLLGLWFGQVIAHDTGSRVSQERNNATNPVIQCCGPNNTRPLPDVCTHPACQPIYIPWNDPLYSKVNVTCTNYVASQRTFSNDCKVGSAHQRNTVSSFLDLTIVYSDNLKTQNSLRSGKNGQMITNANNVLPEGPTCRTKPCYFLGDGRLTQTPMLALWHSLLLRLHNYICSKLNIADDNLAFLICQRLTIAIYQHIIYNEWLPLILGNNGCRFACKASENNCGKYNKNVDPSTINESSGAAFRFGHNFVPPHIRFYDSNRKLQMTKLLSDMNSSQMKILETDYVNLVRGMFDPISYGFYTEEIRGKFVKGPNGVGIDLLSIDIQRARDHGISPYHAYISFCTNDHSKIESWKDLKPYFTEFNLEILKTVYKSPRDIDLFIGIIFERREGPYSLLGRIGICIICEQFKRYKYGDRFFYQWTDGPNPFTREQLREIEKITMAHVLCWTVPELEKVPLKAFLTLCQANHLVDCSSLEKINFAVFRK